MARSRPNKYRRKPPTSVPQSTPDTTAHIESTTGRTSVGSRMDSTKYRVRPRYRDEEEQEEKLSIQSAAATSTASIIGGVTKTITSAAKTVSTKIKKMTMIDSSHSSLCY